MERERERRKKTGMSSDAFSPSQGLHGVMLVLAFGQHKVGL